MKKPLILMILDGFGCGRDYSGNAIKAAKKPNIDWIFSSNPVTQIGASGMDVGLPDGQMGNSEVGHTNIGAGRIVYQELTRITKSIADGDFFTNEAFLAAMENCKKNSSALHLMGLLSDGGVHSHNSHLYALLELAKRSGVKDVYVHCFLDGRDVPPSSGKDYVAELSAKMQELGVGVLYLNPIFMAWSNHRYDTADYRRPDPMLGTEEDFRTLCDAAHARGMRVILDGVFSHTGSNSVYFDAKHVFGHGAASDPNSPYRRWYRFHHYPDDYEAWWGIRTLPCVEELDETYLNYIIEDEDSVIAHWLRLGADGFRLDVVDELPDEFVRRLRRRMRQIDPQSLLLGEVWEDASNKRAYGVSRRYFVDGELDSVMNYPWRNAIVAFLTDADDGTALGESLMTLAENYPPEVLSCVMNHLGTHDTPRILTVLGEPFRGTKDERAHRRMTPVQRKTALMRLRMAAFLQFTLPGMPCIYYGDEAGMEGFEDPFCRVCYPWGHEDEELRAYYRMMTALRGSSEALRRGDLRVLAAGNGRIAFSRSIGGERVVVCVNHSIGEWVLPAGRVRFAESAAPSPTGEVVLMRGGFCLLEPSDPEAHISIE